MGHTKPSIPADRPASRRVVYKYPLPVEDSFVLVLPRGAQVLAVQTQREVPCLWALVDPNEPEKVSLRCHTRATGHPMGSADAPTVRYVGTYQLSLGSLVFHLFMEVE